MARWASFLADLATVSLILVDSLEGWESPDQLDMMKHECCRVLLLLPNRSEFEALEEAENGMSYVK